ncbi:ATP-grasp domain-containing protein [Pseudomonas cucumis]|uniref:ATP-grasp domain-containing protein n=1 Tax=Pseudomonas cucumis TaxID=2954082 RepID=A0ABY9EZ93_9PSED|nr:ATP-grasp domain-containing protein [Pseudomonas cucumis]WLG85676.1 ATP-grasp domain-containing protein [Pseudomonas cucumis]
MNILLLHPVSGWSLQRVSQLCLDNCWRLTIITIESSTVGKDCNGLHEWLRVPALTDDPLELRRQIGDRRFDAVVAGNEFAVIAADVLAAELGLYHNRLDRIRSSRNKALMRVAFAEKQIPQPRVLAVLASLDESRDLDWTKISFPVIVKPVDMAMSLFVRKCDTRQQVEDTLEKIFLFKHSRLTNYAFTAQALIEEFAEGQEYSLEGVIEQGSLVHRVLTTKFVSPLPACYEVGHISGEEVPPQHDAALSQICERIAQCWGMRSGVIHLEFKMTAQQLWVIEAAARAPGCHIPELVELRHGYSIEEAFVRLRAGLPWRDGTPFTKAPGWVGIRFSFLDQRSLEITDDLEVLTEHHDAAEALPGAEAYSVNQRTGYAIVRSASFESISRFVGKL